MKKNIPFKFENNFEFNLLNIENYNNSLKLNELIKFIKKNKNLKGDYFEFGVFQGRTLLSIALLLKKLNIKKKVYGFDSFKGFPDYHKLDNISNFKKLYRNKKISKKHYQDHKTFLKIKKFSKITQSKINASNISTSMDFSKNSYNKLLIKIKKLRLDNVILIKGNFNKTVPKFFKNKKTKIFAGNIDCDLYSSYKIVLPVLWNNLINKGMIMLDEYYSLKFPGAKIACDEFFTKEKIKPYKTKKIEGEFERWFVKKNFK